MALAAGTRRSTRAKKIAKTDETDKVFDTALRNLERLAMDRINIAGHPYKTGIRIAVQLRELASRVEQEVMDENISMTEASESVKL